MTETTQINADIATRKVTKKRIIIRIKRQKKELEKS